ncbi:FecR family protein [Devosia sediminis]|uniref:FecR domain-containing protein n=1 Tax=Devosia sediminis TaxID=2798801 RepID=A0A934IXW5_9HYPH|nr:FecR domain-containing protein [Devosia sediminis]MBJ3784250.1 FecR domain-containing protein [Devosia sediminis]
MMNHSAIAAIACLVLAAPALADAEGTAVGVRPDASSQSGAAELVLVVGSDVSVGDTVTTGPSGHVQLLFDDQTRLVVGPGSRLKIETYLLTGSGADRFAVNALGGTFRFISGNSPKPVYSIHTPTASIAVRGTKFDLTVGGGQTFTMLFEGALTQCYDGVCVDLEDRCDIAVTGGGLADLYGRSDERHPPAAAKFPLPNIQAAFLPDFRVPGAQACLTASPDTTGGASVTTTETGSPQVRPSPQPPELPLAEPTPQPLPQAQPVPLPQRRVP